MKGIHILVFILILNSLIPVFAGEPTHYAIRLSTAPGSTTSQSVSLLWGEGGKTDDDHHYSIYCTSFPQLFYPLMTRQFFCDFHEKSEDFCVS